MISTVLFLQVLSDIQTSRIRSATDSCLLIKAIAILATPPNKTAQATAFINATPLRNCVAYGQSVVNPHGFTIPRLPHR